MTNSSMQVLTKAQEDFKDVADELKAVASSRKFPHKVKAIDNLLRHKINGEHVELNTARFSAVSFNHHWSGHQRGLDQTELSIMLSSNKLKQLPGRLNGKFSGGKWLFDRAVLKNIARRQGNQTVNRTGGRDINYNISILSFP